MAIRQYSKAILLKWAFTRWPLPFGKFKMVHISYFMNSTLWMWSNAHTVHNNSDRLRENSKASLPTCPIGVSICCVYLFLLYYWLQLSIVFIQTCTGFQPLSAAWLFNCGWPIRISCLRRCQQTTIPY